MNRVKYVYFDNDPYKQITHRIINKQNSREVCPIYKYNYNISFKAI